ncbi:negative elongation factor A-like [Chrysoperla carnea]|uniref:negative elongation factor A-like n=1 Tax=Chrysoperla carnea TaxID=189513 RepID=UPI001D075CD5|nr:negative elongation factor A-like [Chrysoperla carnea]
MANVRDSDTSLWLHNKLGTSNDSWTGGSICSQLNAEVLRNIKDCFPDLQTQVKLKLLLSFFHIPRRNVEEWRIELEEIIEVAGLDSELWVSMLAEAMKTFPATGSLNTEITDADETRPIFSDLVNELRKLVKRQPETGMLPLECHYLNKSAVISVVGEQPAPVKHFDIKKKPKSVYLRAELLQKASDAASNVKKSSAPVIPVRSRGMPRKMTDTTPLKGIPSRMPMSGFRSPALSSPAIPGRPPLSRTPAGRKDGGIKLLDITEQPLGYAAAKKRKKMQEVEDAAKKASEVQQTNVATSGASTTTPSATPDYAVGLTTTPSYAPSTPQPTTVTTPISSTSVGTCTAASTSTDTATTTLPAPSYVPPTPQTPKTTVTVATPVMPQLTPQHTTVQFSESSSSSNSTTTPVTVTTSIVTPANPQPAGATPVRHAHVTQIRIQPPPATNPLQRKGLSLTREQMLEAQDMFRTANKVTRPEKALILGFMAGSRDNPCPHLGNIVTIKLSENQENVLQVDNTYLTMMVETHFQMNYNTGEWKRIKKFRKMEPIQNNLSAQTATALT